MYPPHDLCKLPTRVCAVPGRRSFGLPECEYNSAGQKLHHHQDPKSDETETDTAINGRIERYRTGDSSMGSRTIKLGHYITSNTAVSQYFLFCEEPNREWHSPEIRAAETFVYYAGEGRGVI